MNSQDTAELTLGERLLAEGWMQGAIFRAPSASVACNVSTEQKGSEPQMTVESRPLKAKEKLVLTTQDCDLVAPVAEVPRVEALVCRVEKKERYLHLIDRNSARYFVVDPATKLVALATHPVVLAKELLSELQAEAWPSTLDRKRRFIRWLGRRYTRPAVPDQLVWAFDKPVADTFERLANERPEVVANINNVIEEIRVSVPSSELPPYDLRVVMLASTDAVTKEERASIDLAWKELRATVVAQEVQLDPDLSILSREEMPVSMYDATRPVFLEYMSYRGDEIGGALPPEVA